MARSDLLQAADSHRSAALGGLDLATQGVLGQFFTPASAAVLIASMPALPESGVIRVLDPGAGSGMLSAAIVDRILAERAGLSVHIIAVECDDAVLPHLRTTLDACKSAGEGRVTTELIEADFILLATGFDADERLIDVDLVIQNPPYGKLGTASTHRQAMRSAGLDAPNMYAAFLALSTAVLRNSGQLVAITPRSFFNGPYFGSFRRFMLDSLALDRVHVFESRSTVFADTGVLQENVIFAGTVGGERDSVTLSVSVGQDDDLSGREVPYEEVVNPKDPHRFIRVATDTEDTATAELMLAQPNSLRDLGIEVSTGRVVDFRRRLALRHSEPEVEAYPLIYPGNLRDGGFEWPRSIRKAQWLVPLNPKDHGLLLPEGWYTVIKRFSAKEERRRIVASVWSPLEHPGPVAFENHLNILHAGGRGLDEGLSRGLAVWFNSSMVDRFFRTFSGHTQVNATDLRAMRVPTSEVLRDLASRAPSIQADVDELVLARIMS